MSGPGPGGERDIAIVGGGIVGLAVARELSARRPALDIEVLEREAELGLHQTTRNSGVIHAGIYYAPETMKARLCVEGARDMYELCQRHNVPHERCGKLIVARDRFELQALDELERRGRANGVAGLRRLNAAEIREWEPHCRGAAALRSPSTGIVDFAAAARAMAGEAIERGASVTTRAEVYGIEQRQRRIVLRHGRGETRARFAVFCAGASAARLAVRSGAPTDPRIVPFHGAYLRLRREQRHLVRSLIYPVPDPRLPFLGVHLTRHVSGEVLVGPTALLSLRRPDLVATLTWRGSYRMFRRYWRTGLTELRHASSRHAFVRAAARFLPELTTADVEPAFSGVRAQAVARDGSLIDDFVLHPTERALHVRNAPSPAATASLAIARVIASEAEAALDR